MSLKDDVIKLAQENPELRKHLLPLLKDAGRDRLTRFRVDMVWAYGRRKSPQKGVWDPKGRVSQRDFEKYIQGMQESMKPGGVNEHLTQKGVMPYIIRATATEQTGPNEGQEFHWKAPAFAVI